DRAYLAHVVGKYDQHLMPTHFCRGCTKTFDARLEQSLPEQLSGGHAGRRRHCGRRVSNIEALPVACKLLNACIKSGLRGGVAEVHYVLQQDRDAKRCKTAGGMWDVASWGGTPKLLARFKLSAGWIVGQIEARKPV